MPVEFARRVRDEWHEVESLWFAENMIELQALGEFPIVQGFPTMPEKAAREFHVDATQLAVRETAGHLDGIGKMNGVDEDPFLLDEVEGLRASGFANREDLRTLNASDGQTDAPRLELAPSSEEAG